MDLDNFIIGKTKERRGEGRFGKKSNSCLANIEQQLMIKNSRKGFESKREARRGVIWQKKQQLLSKHRAAVDDKNSQKIAALVLLLAENR